LKNSIYILLPLCIIGLTHCTVEKYNTGNAHFSGNVSPKNMVSMHATPRGNTSNLAMPIFNLIAGIIKNENAEKNKPVAKLKWITDTLKKQKNIELFYSLNGMDWAEVSNKNILYYQIGDTLFVLDKSPKKGLVYYKIKQEYTDKTFATSEIVKAQITDVDMVLNALSANVVDYLNVEVFSDKVRYCNFTITNLVGKILYNQKVKLNTNNNSFNINVESFKKGNYYIAIEDENSSKTINGSFYKN
jgi:hypothetical protein